MTLRNIDHASLQRLIIATLGSLYIAVLLTSCMAEKTCSAYGSSEQPSACEVTQ